jgi:hypothetical protein
MIGPLFPRKKLRVNLDKNGLGYILGKIFHKRILSPCLRIEGRQFLSLRISDTVPHIRNGITHVHKYICMKTYIPRYMQIAHSLLNTKYVKFATYSLEHSILRIPKSDYPEPSIPY